MQLLNNIIGHCNKKDVYEHFLISRVCLILTLNIYKHLKALKSFSNVLFLCLVKIWIIWKQGIHLNLKKKLIPVDLSWTPHLWHVTLITLNFNNPLIQCLCVVSQYILDNFLFICPKITYFHVIFFKIHMIELYNLYQHKQHHTM